MKALKIIARIFFTIFFIVLLFCIVLVLTYTLNAPDTTTGTDSRSIITGPWEQIETKKTKDSLMSFTFDQAGKFSIDKNGKTIADGYFKIDETSQKIKLLMIPGHYTDEFAKYVKYKVLAEVSYSKLEFQLTDDDEIEDGNEPTVTFLINTNDGSDSSTICECEMTDVTIDLYASEHDLTKDA